MKYRYDYWYDGSKCIIWISKGEILTDTYHKRRAPVDHEEERMSSYIDPRKKKKGTFVVKIDDCQKGTWQGKVVWADGETTTYFRSALELIKLMDEALGAKAAAVDSDEQMRIG